MSDLVEKFRSQIGTMSANDKRDALRVVDEQLEMNLSLIDDAHEGRAPSKPSLPELERDVAELRAVRRLLLA